MKIILMKRLLLVYLLFGCFATHAQFIKNNGVTISNTTRITVNDDWTNDAGSVIINDGTITTSGDFINNGSLDASATGGFALKFASTKNFKPGNPRMSFLTVNGPGTALITGTISVKDSLLLKNGIIHLVNATDTIAARANAVVTGNQNSYVEGMVSRAGNGNMLFPFGKDGHYLPLTMHRVQAKKLTATVIDVPSNITSGPGLDSLINFPYAWKVIEQLDSDTAAYVEVSYPNTLPLAQTPVIAREIPGLQFASMGARFSANNAGRVFVRSYSRGTKGLFTVAQGFQNDPVTDSLALVALYNSTGGGSWTNKTNWLSGNINTWFGVTMTAQSITSLALPSNGLTGDVADQLSDIVPLQTINLSGNAITSIPDFSENDEITSLNVSNNKLTFASLEQNAGVAGLNYSTQADFGITSTEEFPVGSAVVVQADAGGANSIYQWNRNGQPVAGATNKVYNIAAIGRSNMGDYVADITNPALPGLILHSIAQRKLATAEVSGKLFIGATTPATQGNLRLYQVKNTKFEIVDTVFVNNDGSFVFEDVVLDDYQVLGFADTLVYDRALPTYFESTIFWEEADTIRLDNNITDLDIVSVLKPGPPSGAGSISGFLEEDVPDGGRLKDSQRAKRVEKSGVSARRVEGTGRGKEEVLTLVAYVFTDANGEFTLGNLSPGNYRINMQYPGYPMDENSDINITIGTALKSNVAIEAHVIDGKINVRKLVITGLGEEPYRVDLFPNPAVDYIRMNFDNESETRRVDVTGLGGTKLISEKAIEKELNLNVQHLPKGIYILQIKEGIATVKTIKVSIE